MPSISACPQCQRNILIYSLASSSQRLRCPHCQIDFPVQAVLSNCVELPPIAEPIDEFASSPPWSPLTFTAPPVPEGGVILSTPTTPELRAATSESGTKAVGESTPEISEPRTQELAAGSEQTVADNFTAQGSVPETATAAGEIAAPSAGSESTPSVVGESAPPVANDETPPPVPPEFLAASTDGASLMVAEKPVGEVPAESEGSSQLQDSETTADGATANSTTDETPAEEYAAEPAAGAPAGFGSAVAIQRGPRRPKQGVGWFGQLVALVLGGVMGLSIGYYALIWIGGRDKDFLNIADKLPSWAVPKRTPRWNGTLNGPQASNRSLGDLLNAPDVRAQPAIGGVESSAGLIAATGFSAKRTDPVADFLPGPRNFIPYSAAQLTQAVADVDQLLGCDHCGSTGFIMRMVSVRKDSTNRRFDAKTAKTEKKIPCEECHGKPNGRITPEVYERLCKLAETVCFAKIGDEDPNLPILRQSVLSVVAKAGSDNSKTQVIGRLAGYLLENGHREQNGIVLAGKLQEVVREGELFHLQMVLFGVPKTVTVVSHLMPNPPLEPQDRVIILGSIVDDPANNVAGYSGRSPRIVWGGLPLRLQNDLP